MQRGVAAGRDGPWPTSRSYSSLIKSSNSTFSLTSGTSNVTFAGKDSVPAMAPLAMALATACSISRWEFTPTIFKNLRTLRLKVSSFIWALQFSVNLKIFDDTDGLGEGPQVCARYLDATRSSPTEIGVAKQGQKPIYGPDRTDNR